MIFLKLKKNQVRGMALFYIFVDLFNDWSNLRTCILLSASALNMGQFIALKSMKKIWFHTDM